MINFFQSTEDKKTLLEYRKLEEVIKDMLKEKGVTRMIAPYTDEYFLIDTKREIYACIENGQVRISNHDYNMVSKTSIRFTDKLKGTIRAVLEVERQLLKKELFKNKIDLIDKIGAIYQNSTNEEGL